MENISVEKNQWQSISAKQLNEKQVELDNQVNQYNLLKLLAEESQQGVVDLTKVNESLQKEREALAKRTGDQEQLIQDRTERNSELVEQVNKRNETIVAKDEQLKGYSTIIEEKKVLEEQINALHLDIRKLTEEHEESLKRQDEQLRFACEKEKYKVEKALQATFHAEKEQVRNETRKETELAIREFYLAEIQRRENEVADKENAYKIKIEKLQEELKKKKD